MLEKDYSTGRKIVLFESLYSWKTRAVHMLYGDSCKMIFINPNASSSLCHFGHNHIKHPYQHTQNGSANGKCVENVFLCKDKANAACVLINQSIGKRKAINFRYQMHLKSILYAQR